MCDVSTFIIVFSKYPELLDFILSMIIDLQIRDDFLLHLTEIRLFSSYSLLPELCTYGVAQIQEVTASRYVGDLNLALQRERS